MTIATTTVEQRRPADAPHRPDVPVEDRLYTRQFFQVFVAAILFMSATALQFHFGQYIEYLGHSVDTLGLILSISMVGTLSIRLRIGMWIDRLGCKPVWLIGAASVALSIGSIQFTERLWLIVILRTLAWMSIAAVMTTVAVFAAQIAPPHRRAESLGTIGLGGFCGMIIGTTLGDVVFANDTSSIIVYRIFFTLSAACAVVAGIVILLLKWPPDQPEKEPAPAAPAANTRLSEQLRIIVKHWPGTVLLIGIVFHIAFCLQSVFLERLADARGFRDIKVFFLVYAPTAMALRLIGRRVPERIGRAPTLIGGVVLLAVGLFFLSDVQSQTDLILPGVLMGAGHCFIFPSMVDLAADRLPFSYRGTGTSIILGAGDLGMLIGYATLGHLINTYGYTTAIRALAVLLIVAVTVFAVAQRREVFASRLGTAAGVEPAEAG